MSEEMKRISNEEFEGEIEIVSADPVVCGYSLENHDGAYFITFEVFGKNYTVKNTGYRTLKVMHDALSEALAMVDTLFEKEEIETLFLS